MPSRNVIVTGHTGFVGRALCAHLAKLGCRVWGLSRSTGSDITCEASFRALNMRSVDFVFHLGGRTGVGDSWQNPTQFYHCNTLGTQNVLEFCRAQGCPLLYVSSYIYGPPQYLPIDENHPLHPDTPYAHSKYLGELLCKFYQQHYGLCVNIVRPFNIYGPHQNKTFVIPHIIDAALHNDVIEVRNTHTRRDFLYIDDFTNVLANFLSADTQSIYNVGYGFSYSIDDIISIIQNIAGTNKPIKITNEKVINEVSDVVSDSSRLCNTFAWKPHVDISIGVEYVLQSIR